MPLFGGAFQLSKNLFSSKQLRKKSITFPIFFSTLSADDNDSNQETTSLNRSAVPTALGTH